MQSMLFRPTLALNTAKQYTPRENILVLGGGGVEILTV